MAWLTVAALLVAAAAVAFAYAGYRGRLSERRQLLSRARHAERELAAAEILLAEHLQRLDDALSAVWDAVMVLDDHLRIVACNPRAVEWFGIEPSHGPSLMHAVSSPELLEQVELALEDPAMAGPQGVVTCDDRIVRVGVVPRPGGGAVVALRDETEALRLARSQRELIANVSHDLRTPLTSLSLILEQLADDTAHDTAQRVAHNTAQGAAHDTARDAAPDDVIRGAVDKMQVQVRALRSIADGLIEINRLESGRAVLRLEEHRLADLVALAVARLATLAEGAEVTVECIVPPDLVVLADERQLVRVLTNLLDNARRFSPRGGRITVGSRASDEPDRVEAFVADEGPGIPPRDVDRVFERFYRGDASRGGEGQGLGLAVTRHIVEGHGGRIWVDTSPPTGGQTGTTMRFTLPLA